MNQNVGLLLLYIKQLLGMFLLFTRDRYNSYGLFQELEWRKNNIKVPPDLMFP